MDDFKHWAEQKNVQRTLNIGLLFLILSIVVIGTYFFHSQIGLIAGMAKQNVLGAFATPTPTIIPTDTPTPLIIAKPTDTPIPQVQTYQQQPVQQQQTNPDPIIHCKVLSCGYIDVPQSVCSHAGCCQIGNNYIPYTDHAKCLQDQTAYDNANHGSQQPSQQNTNSNSNSNNYNASNYSIPTIEPLINCQTSTGTYQLTQQQCDDAHARDQQSYQQYQQIQQNNQQAKQDCVNQITNTYNVMSAKCPTDDNGICKEMLYQTEQQGIAKCQQ